MNENTTLTDIIDAALAAGCQISVTITPKDFYKRITGAGGMNVSESIDWRHSTPGELDLHRFIGLTRRGQTLDGYLSCFMQNGWWTLTDADNLATVIKPDANGNPTLNTELFRSINVLKENTTMKKTTLVHHRTTLITTGFYSALAGGTR